MQKNTLDHIIRERLLFRYTVHCNRFPYLPTGTIQKIDTSTNYKFILLLPDKDAYDAFLQRLRADNVDYLPSVKKRTEWWVSLLEGDESDSLTMVWAWRIVKFILLCIMWLWAPVASVGSFLQRVLLRMLTSV